MAPMLPGGDVSSHDTQVTPGWEHMDFMTQMITGEDMDVQTI